MLVYEKSMKQLGDIIYPPGNWYLFKSSTKGMLLTIICVVILTIKH